MKGVLYYFSGTGNTKWVADRFKKIFKSYNVDIDLVNMESGESQNLKKFDFLIVGSSVYAELPPKIVDDFLNRLNIVKKNMKTIVYSTQAAKSSAASCLMAKKLKKKGFNIVIQSSIRMPNNYHFSVGKKPDISEVKALLIESEKKIKYIVENFMKEIEIKETNSEVRAVFGKLCNKAFKSAIPKISKNISSTKDCGKCGLCLRNCPKNNITFENGHAVFHSKCILCLRCLHICPINAIRYKGKKIDQTQKDIIKSLDLNK